MINISLGSYWSQLSSQLCPGWIESWTFSARSPSVTERRINIVTGRVGRGWRYVREESLLSGVVWCHLTPVYPPSSSNLMSLAACIPSSFRFFSICLLRARLARSSALMAQPMMMACRGGRSSLLEPGPWDQHGGTVDTVLTRVLRWDCGWLCWCVGPDHNTLSLRSQYKMADTPEPEEAAGPRVLRPSGRPANTAPPDQGTTPATTSARSWGAARGEPGGSRAVGSRQSRQQAVRVVWCDDRSQSISLASFPPPGFPQGGSVRVYGCTDYRTD